MRRDGLEAPEEHSLTAEPLARAGPADLTGGLAPEQAEALRSVAPLEPVYPLLHALVGRSPQDFLVRAAVLEALVSAERAAFRPGDLAEVLYWLAEPWREGVVRVLRHAGWLDYDPADGYAVTGAGRWVYEILAFLHKRVAHGDLSQTVHGLEYALEIGLDPLRHLHAMRSRLTALRQEMERARASCSEVILKGAAGRLGETLDLSRQIRAVLDRVPVESREARRVVREIHDLLSRLHRVGADLQAAIAAVGRQQLRLTAGLTVEQVVRALMARSGEELADLGRSALLPVIAPPPLLTIPVVAAAAEQQFYRERGERAPVDWREPAAAPEQADAAETPPEVTAWLAELAEIEAGGDAVPLERAVPRVDGAHSFLRLSLLALAGDGRRGAGVAGQLGCLAVAVEALGDGWPAPLPPGPLGGLTPGTLRPCKEAR